jgi:hypothetical protein
VAKKWTPYAEILARANSPAALYRACASEPLPARYKILLYVKSGLPYPDPNPERILPRLWFWTPWLARFHPDWIVLRPIGPGLKDEEYDRRDIPRCGRAAAHAAHGIEFLTTAADALFPPEPVATAKPRPRLLPPPERAKPQPRLLPPPGPAKPRAAPVPSLDPNEPPASAPASQPARNAKKANKARGTGTHVQNTEAIRDVIALVERRRSVTEASREVAPQYGKSPGALERSYYRRHKHLRQEKAKAERLSADKRTASKMSVGAWKVSVPVRPTAPKMSVLGKNMRPGRTNKD